MSIVKVPFVFLLLFFPVLSLAAEPKVYYWSVQEDYFHSVVQCFIVWIYLVFIKLIIAKTG